MLAFSRSTLPASLFGAALVRAALVGAVSILGIIVIVAIAGLPAIIVGHFTGPSLESYNHTLPIGSVQT